MKSPCESCVASSTTRCTHLVPDAPGGDTLLPKCDKCKLCAWKEGDPVACNWKHRDARLTMRDYTTPVVVYYRPCGTTGCQGRLRYDGLRDGIFNATSTTLLAHEVALDFWGPVGAGGALSFYASWQALSAAHKRAGSQLSCPSCPTLMKALWMFLEQLSVDYARDFACPCCSALPDREQVLIIDGLTMGMLRRLLRYHDEKLPSTTKHDKVRCARAGTAAANCHPLRISDMLTVVASTPKLTSASLLPVCSKDVLSATYMLRGDTRKYVVERYLNPSPTEKMEKTDDARLDEMILKLSPAHHNPPGAPPQWHNAKGDHTFMYDLATCMRDTCAKLECAHPGPFSSLMKCASSQYPVSALFDHADLEYPGDAEDISPLMRCVLLAATPYALRNSNTRVELHERMPMLGTLAKDCAWDSLPAKMVEVVRALQTIARTSPELKRPCDPSPPEDLEPNTAFMPYRQHVRRHVDYCFDGAGAKAAAEDKQRDEEKCTKKKHKRHYDMTPGALLMFCPHGVCMGFKLMTDYEGPSVVFDMIYHRFTEGESSWHTCPMQVPGWTVFPSVFFSGF
jgi:hypothetical protein